MREIDGLGHRVVGVLLECRLHFDVPFGRDVVSRDEYALNAFGHCPDIGAAAVLGNLLHQFVGIKATLLRNPLEYGVHLEQFGAVEHPPDKGEREQRLDAAGAAGDDGERARGRDGGDRGVPDRLHARPVVDASLEVGEGAPLPRQFAAYGAALIGDELHNLLAER